MDSRTTPRRLTRTRLAVSLAATTALALSACSGGSFGSGQEGDTADRPLRIGLIAPLTGPASLEGNAMTNGFRLGLDVVNETGGVLGKDVELVVVDDKSDVATSTQVAQQLVRQEDVDYIFGTIAGDTSLPASSAAAMNASSNCRPMPWPWWPGWT